jgi:hypothetical protein
LFYPFSSQSNGSFNAWLESAVFGLDRWLRQRQGVYEYTSHSSCIFRIQRAQAELNLTLSDGTRIVPGVPVLNLHLWNEHIPPIGQNVSVAWARQVSRAMQVSLNELARHIATCDDLYPIVAVRADMRLGTVEQSAKLSRIVSHYGFEAVAPDAAIQEDGALHRFGENIYLFLLVLATNPIAVGTPILRRDHTLVYLSRRTLELRYGRAVETPRPEKIRPC